MIIKDKPNIILILIDQLSATMLSCTGNKFVSTPNLDFLSKSGTRFERAYCTNPVCLPSRFSLLTGRMASEIGVSHNDFVNIDPISSHIKKNGLGWLIKRAGYETVYGGKVHLPKMDIRDIGFEYITNDEREDLAKTCAKYIKNISSKNPKPFLMVASFINPHDICYMAIRDFKETQESTYNYFKNAKLELETLDKALKIPDAISEEEFFDTHCPPLPINHMPQKDEPFAISFLLNERLFRKKTRELYTNKNWRMHRWAYARLTELVDKQIGIILSAIKESKLIENTVVIVTSDHGDMDSAHKLEHKTFFYNEACKIPLIISYKGKVKEDIVDKTHLISNGLDILPTICEYAGAAIPKDLKGISFKSFAENKTSKRLREYIPLENQIGKMIITNDFKYIVYNEGENKEQLYNVHINPYEMENDLYKYPNEQKRFRKLINKL